MANIIDVAKLAKVSPMTVSRVLNQSGYVKEETKQRVLKAMKEVNFIPNGLARSLVSQKSKTIALIVPDITNPFFTTIARGTEDIARKNGYHVILSNTDEDSAKEQEYVDMCLSLRVDGVIIASAGDKSKANLEKLKIFKIPFVCIDREVEGIDADLIIGDSVAGSSALTQHLIDLGHRHIAYVAGPFSVSTSRYRFQGYKETLLKNGIKYNPAYLKETSYNLFPKTPIVEDLLACEPKPTAIFASNNSVASQIVRELRERKLRVPEDIAIVAFDELEPYAIAEPFLTSAIQPSYNFGSLAVQLLLERIDDVRIKQFRKIVLEPEIVIRLSSLRSS